MRIAILEHFSTLPRGQAPESLVREGGALAEAVATDLAALPGIDPLLVPQRVDRQGALRDALHRSAAALIIAPESDGVLHGLTSAVARTGRLLLGCGPKSIRLATDKVATARYLRSCGVPTPAATPVPADRSTALALLVAHPRPFVLKPRDGCGCQGVRVVRRRCDTEEALARSARRAGARGLMVQRFLEGDAASVSLIVGRSGASPGSREILSLGLNRQDVRGRSALRYAGGMTPWREGRCGDAERLAIRAVDLVRRRCPDLSGYVGIDLVLGTGGAQVIDINPRLTTSYVGLRRLAGPDLARWMLDAAIGLPLPRSITLRGQCRFDTAGVVRMTRLVHGAVGRGRATLEVA